MRTHKSFALVALAIFIPVLAWANDEQTGSGQASTESSRNVPVAITDAHRLELLSYDFSLQANACTLDPQSPADRIRIDAPLELKRLVNPLTTATGQTWRLDFILATLAFYCKNHNGDVPVDALDLFPELLTEQGYQEFITMDPQARFEKYKEGINRVTGKLFSTFATTWNPGGMSWAPQPLDADKVFHAGSRTMFIKGDTGIDLKFKFEVFGPEPDQVAITDFAVIPLPGQEQLPSQFPVQH